MTNKNLISFSLWGDSEIYLKGAISNAVLAREVYPGYICRFYADVGVSAAVIRDLQDNGAEVIRKKREKKFDGAFRRFLAFADKSADCVLIRDCDSRLGLRERAAHDQWISSGMSAHIMRDHPNHSQAIMAGMFSVRNGVLSGIEGLIDDWPEKDWYSCDQVFLEKMVYPQIYDDALEHSEFDIKYKGRIQSFPTLRDATCSFVGEIFGADGSPNETHRGMIREWGRALT